MLELSKYLVDWIGAHPGWAYLAITLTAFSESLAFVGLVIPGAAMMFGAGALIATGSLEFWPTCLWAIAGAALGDGLSFWIGHHYRDRIRRWWPFSRHPGLLSRGESFFHRHGGKSILLGRFVGPVRPVIPVVAGMLEMPPGRFLVTNIVSALGWAPAYLLPGMAFGASLAIAGAVTGRLALLIAALTVLVWLIIAGILHVYRFSQPRTQRWATAVTQWAQGHPRLAWLLGDLLEPGRPPDRALLFWITLLIGGTWLFLGVIEDVINVDPLVRVDQALYHLLQSLRNPVTDELMTGLSELGDAVVVSTVVILGAVWFAARQLWSVLGYWLAAAVFGLLAVMVFKFTLQVPRPIPLYTGVDAFSFPSGHATLGMVVYGFAAVLSAEGLPPRWRVFPYIAAALLISGIALSRLYLGAHWLSDVAGGLALGLAWIALLTIARKRHRRPGPGRMFAPYLAVILLVAGTWHIHASLDRDLLRYAVRKPSHDMQMDSWWQQGWQTLPPYRLDLEGEYEQPLNLQWAGKLEGIRKQLSDHGWHQPVHLSAQTALRYLAPSPELNALPLLPQLHEGHFESLVMVHAPPAMAEKNRMLVVRLWRSRIHLKPDMEPLWVGTVAWLDLEQLPLVSLPVTNNAFDQAIATSQSILSANCTERVLPAPTKAQESAAASIRKRLLCQSL